MFIISNYCNCAIFLMSSFKCSCHSKNNEPLIQFRKTYHVVTCDRAILLTIYDVCVTCSIEELTKLIESYRFIAQVISL